MSPLLRGIVLLDPLHHRLPEPEVHGIEEVVWSAVAPHPLYDGGPGKAVLQGAEIAVHQPFRGHELRLEHHLVGVVVGPVAVDDPPLSFHLVVERGAGVRGEDGEVADVDLGLDDELHGPIEDTLVVSVEPEDEGAVHADAVVVKLVHQVYVLLGLVEPLADRAEGFRRQRLEADQEPHAAAVAAELQGLCILGHIHRGLPQPLEVVRFNPGEQLPGVLFAADDVVVGEEDHVLQGQLPIEGLEACNLPLHIVHAAVSELPTKGTRDRAEVAVEWAAPGRFHEVDREIPLIAIEVPVGEGAPVQGRVAVLVAVDLLQLPPFKIGQERVPQVLRLPDNHAVTVLQSLVRKLGDMHPTHRHRDAAGAEVVGDPVPPVHHRRHGGDPHQVGMLVEIQGFHLFVDNDHIPVGRGEGGDLEQAEGREPEVEVAAEETFLDERRDEEEAFFHGISDVSPESVRIERPAAVRVPSRLGTLNPHGFRRQL